jgi:hypothetical protein
LEYDNCWRDFIRIADPAGLTMLLEPMPVNSLRRKVDEVEENLFDIHRQAKELSGQFEQPLTRALIALRELRDQIVTLGNNEAEFMFRIIQKGQRGEMLDKKEYYFCRAIDAFDLAGAYESEFEAYLVSKQSTPGTSGE